MNKLLVRQKVLLIVIALLAAGAGAKYLWNIVWTTRYDATEIQLSENDLVTKSQLIVVGTPEKSKSKQVKNDTTGSLIFTDWTINVRQTLKGTPPENLVVTVPGGQKFGQKTISDQFDGFKKGTEYILYLTYISEAKWWMPLSTTQAVFERQANGYKDLSGRTQTAESVQALITSASTAQ